MQLKFDFDEQWKPVKGYEGNYSISTKGRIYSHPRNTTKGGYSYGTKNKAGYFCVNLYKNNIGKIKTIHRLVYETFVGPIPKGYDIHHKNHIKTDNRLENLCLVERKTHFEIHKKDRIKSVVKARSKPVIQYTKDSVFIAEYPSASEAQRQTGISHAHILECCKNALIKRPDGRTYRKLSAGGYVWKYKKNVA